MNKEIKIKKLIMENVKLGLKSLDGENLEDYLIALCFDCLDRTPENNQMKRIADTLDLIQMEISPK
ncbi:hypothetical protein ES702_02752 [subsurface metagenome]